MSLFVQILIVIQGLLFPYKSTSYTVAKLIWSRPLLVHICALYRTSLKNHRGAFKGNSLKMISCHVKPYDFFTTIHTLNG